MNKQHTMGRRNFLHNSLLGTIGIIEARSWLSLFHDNHLPPKIAPEHTFYVMPHNHWEGAVFATREAYLEMGLPHIITALKLLRQFPEYRFTLDQVNYIKPFLERYEEEANDFRKYVAEGRLQIVGGTDSMHDTNTPSGESIVRQILYGKTYLRKELNVDVTVGWGIDTFGHSAQMPQILKLAGYRSLWFVRGVPDRNMPTEFFWKGLDGTSIDAYWLPQSYVVLAHAPENKKEFDAFVKKKFELLTPNTEGEKNRVGLAGWDVENPQESLPVLMRDFEKSNERPFSMKFSVPREYEAVVAKRTNRKTISGEFNPIFQGVYSSRIELKQHLRHAERVLTVAEKLGAINQIFGKKPDEALLWKAWEPVLFNQAHDLMSGVMTDHVYADTVRGYEYAAHVGGELTEEYLDFFLSQINTSSANIPIVVFNPLGILRTDTVETEIGFAEGGILDIEIKDNGGKTVPVEMLHTERYADGSIKYAKIIFIATDIPPLGYKVFNGAGIKQAPQAAPENTEQGDHSVMENGVYIILFNAFTGAMLSLVEKKTGHEWLNGPANVVVRQYDGGDFWELYQHLRDGIVRKTTEQPVPTDLKERLSSENQYRGERGITRRGKVFSEFSVDHGFGGGNQFTTRVRIYNGLRRIDIRTSVYNTERFVRYQVMFPTSVANGKVTHEIPFGAITRPNAIEYPAQNWADFSDGGQGMAVLNNGLPGNLTSGSTMLVSLLRSAKIDNYPYVGGYEKWMTSDTGLQLNKTMTFNYAMMPHEGSWQEAGIDHEGQAFNHPLICRKTSVHSGQLPAAWSLLRISGAGIVLSSLKSGADGTAVIRLYEARGVQTDGVNVKFNMPVKSIEEVNLMEDKLLVLKSNGNSAEINFHPFEIKTLKIYWKNK